MGVKLKKFQLIWVDDTTATYPGIVTDNRQHTYEFEVESESDARAFVRSFAMLNSDHDFTAYELREVKNKETK